MTTARWVGVVRLVAVVASVWLCAELSSADDRSFFAGAPLRTTYPNPITFLDNDAFVVGYDEVRRVPAWVGYHLFPNPGTFDFPRPSRFSVDERTKARVRHEDYTNMSPNGSNAATEERLKSGHAVGGVSIV